MTGGRSLFGDDPFDDLPLRVLLGRLAERRRSGACRAQPERHEVLSRAPHSADDEAETTTSKWCTLQQALQQSRHQNIPEDQAASGQPPPVWTSSRRRGTNGVEARWRRR